MAAGDQDDLDLHEAGKAPVVSVEDVKRLVGLLRAHKGWITRRALADSFGGGDRAERQIRAVAEAARPVVVSFPGSPGYRLWDHCTIEEIDRCIATFESTGRKQLQAAHTYRLAYHRRFRSRKAGGLDQTQDLLNLAGAIA